MKTKLILTILLLLHLLPCPAQKRLLYGAQTNVGFFGSPVNSFSKNETDLYTRTIKQSPRLAFSAGAQLEYTFLKIENWSLSVQLEAGYAYTSIYKEWINRWGYDVTFENYTGENQFIHDLQAHYFILPVKGNMKIKNLRFTLGAGLTRTIFASGNRTFKRRTGIPLTLQTTTISQWTTFEKEPDMVERSDAYLSSYYGSQIILGLSYRLKKNMFIGVEASNIFTRKVLLYVTPTEVSKIYYGEEMLTLSFLFFD